MDGVMPSFNNDHVAVSNLSDAAQRTVELNRARRRRWRDKNPDYMRVYRAKEKARQAAEKHRQLQAML